MSATMTPLDDDTTTKRLVAVFDRIGRTQNPDPIDVTGMSPDAASEKIWRETRRYIASPNYDVTMFAPSGYDGDHSDLEGYAITIEMGRFGRGRIEAQEVAQ